ncbi:MAG: metallophosphoesterase [Desulfurococcus sp.]|nr:metallophosphoesterase [Desulfurococcus sp.]
MTRILVLSDIHERTQKLKLLSKRVEVEGGVDAVIVAGDLTYYKTMEVAVEVLRKLREAIGRPVFFIPGNCDDPRLLNAGEIYEGIIGVHGRAVVLDNYVLYGIGGGGISPFHTMIEFSEEEFSRFLNEAEELDPSRLIMATHQPVHGFFDKVGGVNVGSRAFRRFLEERKPLLWVTGHIHEHSGWTRAGSTIIVHPGPFMRGYHALIELSGTTVNRVVVGRV